MFSFGLCLTSDDWPSDLSKKMSTKMQKNKKGPLRHRKTKCSFFGLCSTSDDWPSNPSKKHRPNHKKMEKAP